MAEEVFHRSISSATSMAYNPRARHIVLRTRMYNPARLCYEMREVSIDEEEWAELVRYGREAGFIDD